MAGSTANLPPGVPLPFGAPNPDGFRGQFFIHRQSDLSISSPDTGYQGFAGSALPSGATSGANSSASPVFTSEQPVASESHASLASAPQSGWSIIGSPNPPPSIQTHNGLAAVTCASASDCWVVGSYDSGDLTQRTLIEHWDGTSWATVSSPNTSTTQSNFLKSVTCVSASECWAVGSYVDGSLAQTLIERWDGASWTIVASPNTSTTQSNFLNGVTCTSTANCWAVGYYYNGNLATGETTSQTLIVRWDGTSWVIVDSPNSVAESINALTGVTCTSASDCWAVGYSNTARIAQTLIERWDGASWTIAASPNSPLLSNYLYGVTCTSTANCWAVGVSGSINQTLIEHWDGTSWTIVTSPNTSTMQTNILTSVTCMSASDCWAVGYSDSTYRTLIERWDGTSWAIINSPNTSATQGNQLFGVTCMPASNCWAIGYYVAGSSYQTLIERWDGTSWNIAPSPNTVITRGNYLVSVACMSASDCWAVGSYSTGIPSIAQTLIERWDGTSWAIFNSPNTNTAHGNGLYSVTCVSPSDCWAVGSYLNGNIVQTLIEHWDGASWAIVSSPNTSATQDNVLASVTCVSASDCWAVGYYDAGAARQTLIERWNGASWSIVNSPNTSATQSNFLRNVTCVPAAADCWAVGYYVNGSINQTLIEHWDGTSWTLVTSPNPVTSVQYSFLQSVKCVSGSECWAVGHYLDGITSTFQTLIERWDGTAWAIVTSPNTSTAQSNLLFGLTCPSGSECWAVGSYSTASGVSRTLIERWDGASWAIVNSPNTSTAQSNSLNGVTCVAASECWAVGAYLHSQTLVLKYSVPTPIPTSVVSRKTHGSNGTFDIDLPLTGTPGMECRNGGASGDHKVVVTFAAPVTFTSANVSSGTVASTSTSGNTVTVNLTGVPNAQTVTVNLVGVSDGTNTGNIAVPISVLLGDTGGNGSVNSSDIGQTKASSGSVTTALNFRTDVNTNGAINSSDIGLVKSRSGNSLP